jgi:4'-phosphopantetheinyl transferase
MDGEYSVYFARDCGGVSDGRLRELTLRLSREDRARAERYLRRESRLMFTAARLLLCYALEDCFGIRNAEIRAAPSGKPYAAGAENVCFSISHSAYSCICAVARREIGADIQKRVSPSPRLIGRVCSPAEAELLRTAEDPAAVFTDMWALKESLLKLTGEGIPRGLAAADTADYPARGELLRSGDEHIAVSTYALPGEKGSVGAMDEGRVITVAAEELLRTGK